MELGRAYLFSSRLVALSGLMALLFTREAPDWLVVPATVLAAGGMVYPKRFARALLPERAMTALGLAALSFSMLDFFYIGGSLAVAGADLLVILVALKLLSLRADKDYVQLFTVSFFLLLASTALSTEIYFLAAFVTFFVSLTWALMFRNMKGEGAVPGAGAAGMRVGRSFFGGTALLTLVAFAVTLAMFFAIPRVGIGFFSRHAGALIKVSGFSDRVELGSMGQVKLDPTVVMRVELPGSVQMPSSRMYWRGRAFDNYNNGLWQDTLSGRMFLAWTVAGDFFIPKEYADRSATRDTVVQNVVLEPLDTTTIFALYPVRRVNGDFRSLSVDRSGALNLAYPPGSRIRYTAYSDPANPSRAELELEERGAKARPDPKYLQLPEGSDGITRLAMQVTSGSVTDYDKAVRIQGYLKANYAYTLDPPRDKKMGPIEDFLFNSKAGYCEHFATAMALMLRASGVQSRMVTGFYGGEWNEYGGYYLVREQDAHTWVEVRFPESGWVMFDPTPESAGSRPKPMFGRLSNALDFMRFKWDRYVIYYNLSDQMTAVNSLARAYQSMKKGISEYTDRLGGDSGLRLPGFSRRDILLPAAILCMIALLAVATYLLRRALKGRGVMGRRGSVPFYEEMARLLRRRGHVRPPGVTPMEFAVRLSAGEPEEYGGVVYVTELYNRVRFGGRSVSREEEGRVREVLGRLGREKAAPRRP